MLVKLSTDRTFQPLSPDLVKRRYFLEEQKLQK